MHSCQRLQCGLRNTIQCFQPRFPHMALGVLGNSLLVALDEDPAECQNLSQPLVSTSLRVFTSGCPAALAGSGAVADAETGAVAGSETRAEAPAAAVQHKSTSACYYLKLPSCSSWCCPPCWDCNWGWDRG